MKEDEIKIIRRLMSNPRTSYAKIARDLGVSAEGVRQKVLRMLKNGELRLHCVPNNEHLGKRRITLILRVPMTEKAMILRRLKSLPQAMEIRSGMLNNTVVMDIATKKVDEDIHELMKLLGELEVEVEEVFESKLVHFDSTKMLD